MRSSVPDAPFHLSLQWYIPPESLLYLFPFQDETHVITVENQHQARFAKQSTALLLNQNPFEFPPERQPSCTASQKQFHWRQEQLTPSLAVPRSLASCQGH